MSNLSANTLFHFTKLEFLRNILEHGFYPRYSEEVFFDVIVDEGIRLYVPMVCFCDIPLSRIENHLTVYDSYGIGLTKEWGLNNRLNPVFYVQPMSNPVIAPVSLLFASLLTQYFDNNEIRIRSTNKFDKNNLAKSFQNLKLDITSKEKEPNVHAELFQQFLKSVYLAYLKSYKAKEFRGKTDYSYYDEKEWRYIPDPEHSGVVLDFESDSQRLQANELLKNYPLNFDSTDIKYLILKDDNDIEPLREDLKRIHERTGKYPMEVIDILTSRITTCKRIREDY